MATYAIVCLVFISLAVIVGRLYRIKNWRAALAAFVFVAILTLHFEPIMINLGFYRHDDTKTLGVKIRDVIPVEDFLYVVFAALIIPSVWDRLDKSKNR